MTLGRRRSVRIQQRLHMSIRPEDVVTPEQINLALSKALNREAAKAIAENISAPDGWVYCTTCYRLVKVLVSGLMRRHSPPGMPNKPWHVCEAVIQTRVPEIVPANARRYDGVCSHCGQEPRLSYSSYCARCDYVRRFGLRVTQPKEKSS